MYWHHAECRGSFAELHSDNQTPRVCCPVKAGKYGQLQMAEVIGVSEAQLRFVTNARVVWD